MQEPTIEQKAWETFRQMGHDEPCENSKKIVNLIQLIVTLHGEADGDFFNKQTAEDLRLLFDLHDYFYEIS